MNIIDWTDPLETVIQIANAHPTEMGECEAYREILRNRPECIEFKKRPIKTLALYYRRIRNGGAERVVSELCARLSCLQEGPENKFKVILITEEPPAEDDYWIPESIERIQIPEYTDGLKHKYAPRAYALYKIIEDYQIDAFVDSMWNSRALAWDALCVKSHPRHPAFIVHCHGSAAMLYKFKWLPERTFGPNAIADGIVCLSEGDRWYWSQVNSNVRVIANPIDAPGDERLQANGGGMTLLWVGRISREKRPEEALRIFKTVHDKLPDARLIFVGESNNQNLMQYMYDYIKCNDLNDSVSFAGYAQDVSEFFCAADVLLVTSEFEGFCLVLYEAALRGLPIVMYELPYLMFCEQIEGWASVRQRDVGAAASSVVALLRDDSLWRESAHRLRKSALDFYAKDPASEWRDFFESIANCVPSVKHDGMFWTTYQMVQFHSENSNEILRQVQKKEKEILAIRSSRSFRLGKALMRPFSLVKSFLSRV